MLAIFIVYSAFLQETKSTFFNSHSTDHASALFSTHVIFEFHINPTIQEDLTKLGEEKKTIICGVESPNMAEYG